ncbi:MAG: hypothetical protein WA919_02370 [Coleofasciculaceae cyanobacterium]
MRRMEMMGEIREINNLGVAGFRDDLAIALTALSFALSKREKLRREQTICCMRSLISGQ